MRRQCAFPRDDIETPAFIVRPGAIAANRDELARLCGLAGCRALYSLKALGTSRRVAPYGPSAGRLLGKFAFRGAAGAPCRGAASRGAW